MGINVGDIDNDGDRDVAITTALSERTTATTAAC
jgi:hypothetical protein